MFAHLSFTDMDVKPRDHSLGRMVDFIQNGSGSKFGQQNGALFCSIQVDQASMAMKERFGQYQEVLEAGSHCAPWFFGSQIRGNLPLRVQKLDVRCETKTKDNVFVTMVASVQYRALVEKASDAFYKLSGQVSLR